MPRIVHFEIGADDPARAAGFYRDAFGWEIQQWGAEQYWNVVTGPDDQPGINGGIFVRKGPVGHVNVINVPDIDEYQERVVAAGGEVVVPKAEIPTVGWVLYFKDTEGCIAGLFERRTDRGNDRVAQPD